MTQTLLNYLGICPCWSCSVAEVCLKSWNRILGKPESLSAFLKFLIRLRGSIGVPVVEGKIKSFSFQRSPASLLSLYRRLKWSRSFSTVVIPKTVRRNLRCLPHGQRWHCRLGGSMHHRCREEDGRIVLVPLWLDQFAYWCIHCWPITFGQGNPWNCVQIQEGRFYTHREYRVPIYGWRL